MEYKILTKELWTNILSKIKERWSLRYGYDEDTVKSMIGFDEFLKEEFDVNTFELMLPGDKFSLNQDNELLKVMGLYVISALAGVDCSTCEINPAGFKFSSYDDIKINYDYLHVELLPLALEYYNGDEEQLMVDFKGILDGLEDYFYDILDLAMDNPIILLAADNITQVCNSAFSYLSIVDICKRLFLTSFEDEEVISDFLDYVYAFYKESMSLATETLRVKYPEYEGELELSSKYEVIQSASVILEVFKICLKAHDLSNAYFVDDLTFRLKKYLENNRCEEELITIEDFNDASSHILQYIIIVMYREYLARYTDREPYLFYRYF